MLTAVKTIPGFAIILFVEKTNVMSLFVKKKTVFKVQIYFSLFFKVFIAQKVNSVYRENLQNCSLN
jgi:hypothetical protein